MVYLQRAIAEIPMSSNGVTGCLKLPIAAASPCPNCMLPIHMLIWLGVFCLWLYLMWKAYQGEMVVLPIIGPLAKQQAGL